MKGFQQITLLGNLGRDPELRYARGGKAFCNFAVAVSYFFQRQGSLTWEEEVTWFEVVFFGKAAEVVDRSFRKGDKILVTGKIKVEPYLKKNGAAGAHLKVIGQTFTIANQLQERDAYYGGGGNGRVSAEDAELEEVPFD